MRRAVIPFCLACLSTVAQADSAGVEGMVWSEFEQICTSALREPSAFIDALEVPGPSGERVVSVSDDAAITWVLSARDTLMIDVRVIDLAGAQSVDCALTVNILDGSASGAAFDTALQERAAGRDGLDIVGGLIEQDYPNSLVGAPGISPMGDTHVYAAKGVFAEFDAPVWIEASSSYFAMSTTRLIHD